MPRKLLSDQTVPTLIAERLVVWGKAIRTQRVRQRIVAADLCLRIDISRATLSRMERGDAAVSAAAYLSALLVLGILDEAMPLLSPQLWSADGKSRVRARQNEADDDYF